MGANNAQGIQEICNCCHGQRVKDVEKSAEEGGVGFEDVAHFTSILQLNFAFSPEIYPDQIVLRVQI